MALVNPSEIAPSLAKIPAWKLDGSTIRCTYQFHDFAEAMHFVNWVAQVAEDANHHPDIDIRWNRVTLALTTHDQGGLTTKDFEMAARCDKLAT